jgi:ribosomal protein L10
MTSLPFFKSAAIAHLFDALTLGKGGAMEGGFLDSVAVKAMETLPTRKEAMTRIAVALKMAGAQGIAMRLKEAAGGKLARALKLALTNPELRPFEMSG